MAAPPPDVDLSPFATAVAVASMVVGPKLAQYIGAYAFILLGWFAGLLFGIYSRSTDSRMPPWAYALFTLLVCLCTTVPIAQLASDYVGAAYTGLLFPIAAAIPARPDLWAATWSWLLERWQLLRGVKQ